MSSILIILFFLFLFRIPDTAPVEQSLSYGFFVDQKGPQQKIQYQIQIGSQQNNSKEPQEEENISIKEENLSLPSEVLRPR